MVIGMSRRDGRRKYKKRGKRKNQIFLVMMTILACTVAIVLTVKMNNKNVGSGYVLFRCAVSMSVYWGMLREVRDFMIPEYSLLLMSMKKIL